MYLTKDIGKLQIEYCLDETSPGPRTYCVVCGKAMFPEDERVVLRRTQHNRRANRAGQFYCALCANELANGIKSLLGE